MRESSAEFGALSNKIRVLDAWSDPQGWLPEARPGRVQLTRLQDVANAVLSAADHKRPFSLFVDDLASLVLRHSAAKVVAWLASLERAGAAPVVALLHRECVSEACDLAGLEHAASTLVRMLAGATPRCSLVHKRGSGRVAEESLEFAPRGDGTLRASAATTVAEGSEGKAAPAPAPDPTAGLSFNMKLTDKQRAERAAAPLPYAHRGNEVTGHAAPLAALIEQVTRAPAAGPADGDKSDGEDDDDDPDQDLDI